MELKKNKEKLKMPQRDSATAPRVPVHHASPIKSDTPRVAIPNRRLRSRKRVIIAVTIIIVAAGLAAWQFIGQRSDIANSPSYQTVLPDGKSVNQLGGWKRVSPPQKDPVFAYSDSIDDISVSVSQQPLPKSFAANPASQIAELAKSYNATTKIDAEQTVVYIGTSAKGPQSVIFTKDNLLVLIKSQKKIDNKSWVDYINSLHLPGAGRMPKF